MYLILLVDRCTVHFISSQRQGTWQQLQNLLGYHTFSHQLKQKRMCEAENHPGTFMKSHGINASKLYFLVLKRRTNKRTNEQMMMMV